MGRTPQDENENLTQLSILEVASKPPAVPTQVTNQRVLDMEAFVPQLQAYHGSFVKVLQAVDIAEIGKWQRAAKRVPNLVTSSRRAHGSGNPRLRDLWIKYDEGTEG